MVNNGKQEKTSYACLILYMMEALKLIARHKGRDISLHDEFHDPVGRIFLIEGIVSPKINK